MNNTLNKSNTLNDNLVTMIIGDEMDHLDGLALSSGSIQGVNYHIDSLKKIVKSLEQKGYNTNYVDFGTINDAAFHLINHGHIVFINIQFEETKLGYLFVPESVSDKQFESLDSFENELSDFQLNLMTISKKDPELFDGKLFENNFSVQDIKKTKRK